MRITDLTESIPESISDGVALYTSSDGYTAEGEIEAYESDGPLAIRTESGKILTPCYFNGDVEWEGEHEEMADRDPDGDTVMVADTLMVTLTSVRFNVHASDSEADMEDSIKEIEFEVARLPKRIVDYIELKASEQINDSDSAHQGVSDRIISNRADAKAEYDFDNAQDNDRYY